MYYTINKSALLAAVEAEVSKVADEAYAEDGTSLYDLVVITSKDHVYIDRSLDDAAHLLVAKCSDIATFDPQTSTVTTVTPRINFNVPDFVASQEDALKAEIDRYMAMYASNALFRERRISVVEEYTGRVQEALDNVNALLRKRTTPTRA